MVERNRNNDRDERGGRESSRGDMSRDQVARRDRGGDRGSSRFSYQPRDRAAVDKRASMGANDFDKILKDSIKMWSPKGGNNRIRILPPTWPKPEHYGYDIHVHYGVGPDRATYLDLDKMKSEPDPISEERAALKRSGDASEQELKDMDSKRRVLVYLIDRDNEAEGVQAWAMSWTIDKDISVLSVDKATGQVLNIDDPEDGYDIEFRRDGEGIKTKYTGIAIARRSSPLGSGKWLDFAIDNPLPDQLKYFSYDEIAKVFGGGGVQREKSWEVETVRSDSDRSDSNRSRREEQEDRGSRSDVDRGGRGNRREEVEELTYEIVHGMTADELDALVDSDKRLDKINPNDAESNEQLAEWICEDLGLKKAEVTNTHRRSAAPAEEEGASDKLRRMREERGSGRR